MRRVLMCIRKYILTSCALGKMVIENSIAFASAEAKIEGIQQGLLIAAQEFKKAGIPIVQISETLGFSIEEIEKI